MTLGAAKIATLALALGLAGAGCIGKGLDTEPESYPYSYSYGDPRSVSGLRIWVKATDYRSYYGNGGAIATNWVSGGTLPFSLVPTGSPIYDGNAGLGGEASTIDFNAAAWFSLPAAGFAASATAVTIIVLAKWDVALPGDMIGISGGTGFPDPTGNAWVRFTCAAGGCSISAHANGGTASTQTAIMMSDAAYRIHTGIWNSAATVGQELSYEISGVNSTTINGTRSPLPLTGTFFVGNAQSGYRGNIAEVLVWERALSAAERQTISTYLRAKYSLP